MRFFSLIASWLYGLAVGIRNFLYDEHLLRASEADVFTLCVGNLSVGGTGKTPHTELIARELAKYYKVAILSRGYKRSTRGFRLVDAEADARVVGDEVMQLHLNLPDVPIAVCEDRAKGCRRLRELYPLLQVIVLDDGFQHRNLHCSYYVMLTRADQLYVDDHLLPYGMLREPRHNSLRANAIIVTKCAPQMSPIEKRIIANKLQPTTYQSLYFSWLAYDQLRPLFLDTATTEKSASSISKPLILTGIADASPMVAHLKKQYHRMETLSFSDHHTFTGKDMQLLLDTFTTKKCDAVITTQKDAVRLLVTASYPEVLKACTFVLPVRADLRSGQKDFFDEVKRHIEKSAVTQGINEY